MSNRFLSKNLTLLVLLVFCKLSIVHSQTDIPIEAYNQMRDQLNEEIRDLRHNKSKLNDSISIMIIKIADIEKNVQVINDERAELELRLISTIEKSNLEKEKINELNTSISSLQDQKNKVTTNNEELKLEINKLNADNTKLKKQIFELENLNERVANLTNKNRDLQQSVNRLNRDNQRIEETNKELKKDIQKLQNQLAQYELFEEEAILSIGEKIDNIIDLPVVDPNDEELLEVKEKTNRFLVSFPESESLLKYRAKINEHLANLNKFTNAGNVLERDYDKDEIEIALSDLSSIANPSDAFKELIKQQIDLIESYCAIYRRVYTGIRNIDLTPPRIIKQNELGQLMDISSDYPFLQKVLKEKEENIMEEGNPLREVECK